MCTCCIHIDDVNIFKCGNQSQSNKAGNKSAEYSVDHLVGYIQRSCCLWYGGATVAIFHWHTLTRFYIKSKDFVTLLPNFPSEFVYIDAKQSTLMTRESIQKFANRHFNFPSIAASKCQAGRPSGTNFVNNDQWLWLTVNCRGSVSVRRITA